jgi:hypothetical protein
MKHWIQLKPKGRQVFVYGRHPSKPRAMRYVAAVPLDCQPGAVSDQIKVSVADLQTGELEAIIERTAAFLVERQAKTSKAATEASLQSLGSQIQLATAALLAGARLPADQAQGLYDQIIAFRGHLLRLQRGKPLAGSVPAPGPSAPAKQSPTPKAVRARTPDKVTVQTAETVPAVALQQVPASASPAEPLMLNVGRARPGLRDAVRGVVSSK